MKSFAYVQLFFEVAVAAAGISLLTTILFMRLAHAAPMHGKPDCMLVVPSNPLTAQGLATPYRLKTVNAAAPCHESDPNVSAFVQAAVFDPATSTISVYNPLVIDDGTTPAVAPVVPSIPANAVVGIWFGFNGNVLQLTASPLGTLGDANCVNGLGNNSPFGQFAACNAVTFFSTVNQAIGAGKLTVPALGTGKDGLTCPTVRDFSIVDMDQSDNVTTRYLANASGQTAQNTAANAAALTGATLLKNASDNGLLGAVDAALGCAPWMALDLANPGHMASALPLDELQAAAHQAAPIALVPAEDPMVLHNNQPNATKMDNYRVNVDQAPDINSETKAYCANLEAIAPARLQADQALTSAAASPVPAAANSLFTFLAQRFQATWGPDGLNCAALLGMPSPITATFDANGVAISGSITMPH